MSINSKKQRVAPQPQAEAHLNFMGGKSYDIKSPILKLVCVSASSFFGEPMYYKGQSIVKKAAVSRHQSTLSDKEAERLENLLGTTVGSDLRKLSPKAAMEKVIDEALDFDPELTLKWACILRNEEFIRVTPQVILVRAANHANVRGTTLVRQYAKGIIMRADEPSTQLAYQLEAFGKPIPNSLKRAWSDFLTNANDYSVAKYKMEDRIVKTVDVANMSFGKGFYGYKNAIGKLVRGELALGDDISTWESIRSAGGSWEKAIEVMGHMALLRNIRNFVTGKVDPKLWVDKLVKTAETGKQLPFRYLSAFNANTGAPGTILDAIEKCFEMSVGNLPRLDGSSLVLTDNSGSAHGTPISELSTMTVAKIGNLMGVLTGMVSDEGVLGVFGDRLEYINIRKKASIMDQANAANDIGKRIGHGTENGIWLALDDAIKNKKHWDNIFVYSDMQAGHGGLYGRDVKQYRNYCINGNRIDVPKLVMEYRKTVNPKVNVFLVQIAGYEDTLIPEFYDRTFIIGGWSGSIIKFARRMIDTANGK